tara:strand:+ start:376 stop:552 length:177 start_codon:yes stop_codon:yes gene_type:complete
MPEETTLNKASRMVENFMISWAIQDAINQKAIYPDAATQKQIEAMIAELAKHFTPAEA